MTRFQISKQSKTRSLLLSSLTALMIASPAVAQQFQLTDPRQAVQNRLLNNQFGSHSHQHQHHQQPFRHAGYQELSDSAAPAVPNLPLAQGEITAFQGMASDASGFQSAEGSEFPQAAFTSPRTFSPSAVSTGTITAMPESMESMSEEVNLEELVAMQVAAIQKEDQSAYTTGYDGGFRIKPRDKEKNPFELKINGRLQFRWSAFQRDSETFTNRSGTIGVPSRNDFEIERGRLEFKGFILDPKIKYYFNLDADTDDNHDVIFHDFWFDRVVNDNLTVRLGKAKVPSSYEWLEASTSTRFADRSVATTYFRADRSLGIWFLGETPNKSYYQVGITNGFRTTDLEPEDVDNNFAYSALTYRDFGSDFGKGHSDLEYHTSPSIRVGSSFSYTNTNAIDGLPTAEQNFARVSDGARLTDTGALAPGLTINDFDQYALSGFMSGKWRGFSFNAEYYARWLQNFETVEGPNPGINDLFDSGFYVDAGYFVVPEKFEINGRISQIDGLFGDSWEYAAGCNYFLNGTHKNKLSFDATVLDGIPTSSSSPNFELGQDGILYRLQYQIAF